MMEILEFFIRLFRTRCDLCGRSDKDDFCTDGVGVIWCMECDRGMRE